LSVYKAKLCGIESLLLKISITLDPAGTVSLFWSKATFWVLRFTVILLLPDGIEDAGLETLGVGVAFAVCVDVEALVEEQAEATTKKIINNTNRVLPKFLVR
jgi:hypothetical protein